MTYYSDDGRHLVCVPYSIEGLHQMAAALGVKQCWYHPKPYPHYDIPKKRIEEIKAKTVHISNRSVVLICKGEYFPPGDGPDSL